MTLEDALGRPVTDLEDAVLARAMFHYVKHGCDGMPAVSAEEDIDAMSNTDFLRALSIGLSDLRERGLL